MKKIQLKWFLLFAMALLLITTACKKNFLDQKTLSVIDEHAVFSDSLLSWEFVNSRYANVNYSFDYKRFGNGGLEAACDEAEPSINASAYPIVIVSGAANASNVDKGVWTTTYNQVRACNIFLKNKAIIPVKTYTRNRWVGEVRFLRAWYLFSLFKHYGGIPLIGDKVYSDADKIDVARSTYDATVNYIAAECDTAASLLPYSYSNPGPLDSLVTSINDYGRVTKGSALGLKSRLLLYAASPLANDGSRTDDPDHLVSYATADINRWKKAVDAAQAVINLNRYSLYRGSTPYFYQMFLQWQCDEHIFAFMPPFSTDNACYLETLCNPISRGTRYSGKISCFPTQELVDAFGMSNGLPIKDAASGYLPGDKMYLNRDSRFYASISYNGSARYYQGYGIQSIWTYTGVVPSSSNPSITSASADGIYATNGTITGYFRYKMIADNVVNGGSELNRPRVLIRYGEILLNAAEATNEFSGPTTQIYTWLQDIRNRAGITPGTNGLYGMKANMTKDEMRAFIQNERRVEMAFEEQRFWDIRRWKIAPVIENAETHGMEITRATDGSYSYRTIVIRKHIFNAPSMYYWPVPKSELTKSSALKQNPGY